MRRHPKLARPARPGFTLVELLVVIAIIAVLISLTAAAVFRVREQANVLKNRHNISQLSTAIQGFSSKTGVDYIPSRIVLHNDLSKYLLPAATGLEKASLTYLLQLWPRLGKQSGAVNRAYNADIIPNGDPRYSEGWCPDDPSRSLNSSYELEGDQCIVFFLGGIQYQRSCQGFGNDKTNPTAFLYVKRDASFMEFKMEELDYRGLASPTRAGFFLSFIDPYGQAYAYFSSRSFGRRYLPNVDPQYQAGIDGPYLSAPGYARLDCDGLLNGDGTQANLCPYFEPSGKFYVRDSYQIISAGADKKYGSCIDAACNPNQPSPANPWPRCLPYDSRNGFPFDAALVGTFGAVTYPGGPQNVPNPPPGHDDLTNFHSVQMGVGE